MYYPKSQIQTGLYTNGSEYVGVGSGVPYKGKYWITSQNTAFTGEGPQDPTAQQLQQISTTATVEIEYGKPVAIQSQIPGGSEIYRAIKGVQIDELFRQHPKATQPRPTEQDYVQGYFMRYFFTRLVDGTTEETTKDQYDLLRGRDVGILWEQYTITELRWQLVGAQQDVYRINERQVLQKNNKNLASLVKNEYLAYHR